MHSVTVVIPTVLRPELPEAIKSVRAQDYVGDLQIIVVVDRAEADCRADEIGLTEGADIVAFTGGRKRGGFARNLGISLASGDFVALLDDDDTWYPTKIRRQLELSGAQRNSARTVVSSRVSQSVRGSGEETSGIPQRLIDRDERVEDYLFHRRKASLMRAGIFTSTLLLPRLMAQAVPWDETLARHQDWDWLCRLQKNAGAVFAQVETSEATIWMGTAGSISASSDWAGSLAWADSWRRDWAGVTYVDFVAGQSLRYATQSKSVRGVLACLKVIVLARRMPSLGPLLLGIGGLVPRKLAVSLILRGRRARVRESVKGTA